MMHEIGEHKQQQQQQQKQQHPPHVVFIHLDLGIGGAEQLVLQLAHASVRCGHRVSIVTTRCDPNHSFASVKPGGPLHSSLFVWGSWIPAHVLGKGQALCSTIRLLYLAYQVTRYKFPNNGNRHHSKSGNHNATATATASPELIVLDVLPTPLPLLRILCDAALLFYCHFPDQLLLRQEKIRTSDDGQQGNDPHHQRGDRDGGEGERGADNPPQGITSHQGSSSTPSLQSFYRYWLDQMENATMQQADLVVVNSKFTRETLMNTLPSFRKLKETCHENANTSPSDNSYTSSGRGSDTDTVAASCTTSRLDEFLPVLYPALDTESLDQTLAAAAEAEVTSTDTSKNSSNNSSNTQAHEAKLDASKHWIVSLNRYERKKNLELLLQAAAWVRDKCQKGTTENGIEPENNSSAYQIVIAGGYDTHNIENVEYRAELVRMAREQLQLPNVIFLSSISDHLRATLLKQALVVVYTPALEHFGIVPLEAMYAGTPVLAVHSGGPLETIRDGVTGYLCANTAAAFGTALSKVLKDPSLARSMGQAGRKHVIETFGPERLREEWEALTRRTVVIGQKRFILQKSSDQYRMVRVVVYLLEAAVMLALCLLITYVLRRCGVLGTSESIVGKVKRLMRPEDGDEL